MLYGILVVYSENYLVKSINEFKNVLNLTARKHKIIIILNNPELESELKKLTIKNFDYLLGSNNFHEFGGWSEGLKYIKKKYLNDYQNSDYIFCNDTFCHHRPFNNFHRLIFSYSSTIAFLSKKPKVAGELHSTEKLFDFNNIAFKTWVSSYYFAVNKSAMQLMQYEVILDIDTIDQYLHGGIKEELFFTDKMDPYLKKYLLDWLFYGGWYKSARLKNNNKYLFYKKAMSILAEFLLSSNLHKNKIGLIDTYYLIRLIDKFKNKFGLV